MGRLRRMMDHVLLPRDESLVAGWPLGGLEFDDAVGRGHDCLGVELVLGLERIEDLVRRTGRNYHVLHRVAAHQLLVVHSNAVGDVLVLGEDAFELVPYELVVGLVFVGETHEVVVNVSDLDDVLCNDPQLLLGIVQALGFNVLHLVHRVLLLLAPLQLFVQEVEDDEVETPDVVPSGKVLLLVIEPNRTMLLCALREAKDTVPLKSAFLRGGTGTPFSRCFFASPKSTMYTCLLSLESTKLDWSNLAVNRLLL